MPYALGLRLPFSGTIASGVAFSISSTSTSDVVTFSINNAASGAECVQATSNGSGNAVEVSMTGAGRAGSFSNTNAGNNVPALRVSSAGSPIFDSGTLNVVNTGNGRAAYFENDDDGIYTIRAHNTAAGGQAGHFIGDVLVAGNLSATGTKPFCIDHPLDPANKYLRHYALESPEVLNVYRGTIALDARGQAWVDLPAYFEALNRDFAYQLTPIGAAMPNLHVADEVASNRFRIAGGKAGKRVSWQVTATRNDAFIQHHGAPVETDKAMADRGRYLNPECFGQPLSLRVGSAPPATGDPIRRLIGECGPLAPLHENVP